MLRLYHRPADDPSRYELTQADPATATIWAVHITGLPVGRLEPVLRTLDTARGSRRLTGEYTVTDTTDWTLAADQQPTVHLVLYADLGRAFQNTQIGRNYTTKRHAVVRSIVKVLRYCAVDINSLLVEISTAGDWSAPGRLVLHLGDHR